MNKTYFLNYNYYSRLIISSSLMTLLFIVSIMLLTKTINNKYDYNTNYEYKISNTTSINSIKYIKDDIRYINTITYIVLVVLNTFYLLLTIKIIHRHLN